MNPESPGCPVSEEDLSEKDDLQKSAHNKNKCLHNHNTRTRTCNLCLQNFENLVVKRPKPRTPPDKYLSLKSVFSLKSYSRFVPVQSVISLLILFVIFVIPVVRSDGLCDPRLCQCLPSSDNSVHLKADCSSRSFLSLPSGLPSTVSMLDLSKNDIDKVNVTEVTELKNLIKLDLSNNRVTKLVGSTNNYVVRILDISHNNIGSIRSLRLSSFFNLTHLDLSYNKIASIPPNSFANGAQLQILNVASNNIEILEKGCFDELLSLQELRLNRNKLSSFPKRVFFYLGNLRVLELNKNKFVEVQGLSFHGLVNLRILKLRRNEIKFLMDGAFYGLDNIEQLFLDRNHISTVSKGWLYGLYTLQELSLAYNNVDYIEDDGWEFCRDLHDLDLRGNELKIVERDILRRLPSLTKLSLQDNLVSHIEPEDTFLEVPLLEVLGLDGNQLSHTIEDTPEPFHGLNRLKQLTLSRNAIKSVGAKALVGLENLEQLDLSDNVVSTIQENPFSHLPLLTLLHLNTSSLLCDCNLRWFPTWINETGVDGVEAKCAHPENLKNKIITDIPFNSFTCDDFPKPYILEEPKTQIALRGKNLTLYCRAASTSAAKMAFTWKKNSKALSPSACEAGVKTCIRDIEHSFDGKGMEITSELVLTNLGSTDIGRYQCVVENIFGATYSSKAKITVYVYPRFVLTPSDLTVTGGGSATLKCSATGVPQPDISWQKDSGSDFPAARERRIHVDPETNTYVITDVRAADMGVYTCTANNPAGSISTNISLAVLEKPRFVKPMLDKKTIAGETAVLECQSSGSPEPRLAWKKNGGPLYTTERHFFTANNQLLIIVKAQARDTGRYECEMTNPLGTESQTSFLTVTDGGVGGGDGSFPTTGIIIIAVACCMVGTSCVWVLCIYFCRRRTSRTQEQGREWLPEHQTQHPLLGNEMGLMGGEGVLELAVGHPVEYKEPEGESERDSGTGDSKRSYDNMENTLVDAVIHNFLSARGEGKEGEEKVEAWQGAWREAAGGGETQASMSDLDTGISSGSGERHREGCPRASSILGSEVGRSRHGARSGAGSAVGSDVFPRSGSKIGSSSINQSMSVVGSDVFSIVKSGTPVPTVTLAVENPLYDSLPIRPTPGASQASRGRVDVIATPTLAASSPPASVISDSVMYCGRFPAADAAACLHCGELRCPHRDIDEVSLVSSAVSSAGQSSATERSAASDQPLSFQTFHPLRGPTNHDRISGSSDISTPLAASHLAGRPELLVPVPRPEEVVVPGRKRMSAIELDNGETYLAIESNMVSPTEEFRDPRDYRGGGTLSRQGLHQEWLEASLISSDAGNSSTHSNAPLTRGNKERGSKMSLFRGSKRNSRAESGGTLPRKRQSNKPAVVDQDHCDVANKANHMFT